MPPVNENSCVLGSNFICFESAPLPKVIVAGEAPTTLRLVTVSVPATSSSVAGSSVPIPTLPPVK